MSAIANLNGQLAIAPANNAQGALVGLQIAEPSLLTSVSVAQWKSAAFNLATAGNNYTINIGTITGIQMLMVSADNPCLIFMIQGGSTNVWAQFFCFAVATVNVTGLVITSTVDNTNVNVILAGT
jgi:hypothetical protein